MLRLIALPFVVAIAAPVVAQSQAPATTPQQQTPAPTQEKKICHSEVATGSIMPHRVCHSAAEWQQISERDRQDVDRFRDNRQKMPGAVAPR